jgi:alcohol dehydrogenase class IV
MLSQEKTVTPLAGRYNQIPIDSILFGRNARAGISAELDRLGVERAFAVVSGSLSRAMDVEAMLAEATGGRVAAVFLGARPHVPTDVVLEAADAARAVNADAIISVGGGSPIDLAKAVSLCLADDLRTIEAIAAYRVLFEYPDKIEVPQAKNPGLPHIAISTTLSAGEFTNIIGITDTVRKVKDLYVDPMFVPRVIALDPELSVHTPRDLWTSTGLRAVDHAVEALCSTSAQPVTDALAVDALDRLFRYLPVSGADAGDLHAAGQCQVAAWQSIFGLTNVTLGLSHGIGHQLGARCAVPHGITSCVMLPTVLEHNAEYTGEAQERIARVLGDARGTPVPEGGLPNALREFIRGLGLPTTLSEVGVQREDFAAIAHDAMEDMIVATNPRPVAGEHEVVELLEVAYS